MAAPQTMIKWTDEIRAMGKLQSRAVPYTPPLPLRERVARCERERATSRVRGHGAQHKLLPLTRSLPRIKSGVGTTLSRKGRGEERERLVERIKSKKTGP